LARSATEPHDKARLLNMARAWTELADRVEKLGRNTAPESALAPQKPPDQADAGTT